MGTYVVAVPAGTSSIVQAVTPTCSVMVAPAVNGGSVLLESSPTPNGPWSATGVGLAQSGQTYRAANNSYVRCSATTQAANLVISEMAGQNSPLMSGNLVSCQAVMASGPSTAIQVIGGLRIPPGFLSNPNFRLELSGSVVAVNSATVKTITVVMNGVTGSTILSFAMTSLAAGNFWAAVYGVDGTTLKGTLGVLGTPTATAEVTLARDYINNETEIVVAATKATGTDLVTMNSFRASLYQ